MNNLDPKVIVVFFIKNFLGTVYILPLWFVVVFFYGQILPATVGFLSRDMFVFILEGAGIIFLALIIIGSYYWSWFTFNNFTYGLQPDGLHIRTGVLFRRELIIPFSSIESVEILVNPLVVRFLQLYTLRIKTRELLNTEGVFRKKLTLLLPGLTPENARLLRPELLQYSHVQPAKRTFFDTVSGHYK